MRLSRVGESAWLHAQAVGVQSLYERQLVRGKVYAIDGSGLGDDFRLVALVCVSATRPLIVAWRLLSGSASEKGQEAAVTRSLLEQVLQVAGPRAISLLLADALYADGPRFSWLTYRKGIDALVSLPEDRLLSQDLQGLADGQLIDWTHHRSVRTISGHKQVREVEVTAAGALTSWDGFLEKAAHYGVPDASLWACLIRDVTSEHTAAKLPRALVSTRHFSNGFAAFQAFRPRWHHADPPYKQHGSCREPCCLYGGSDLSFRQRGQRGSPFLLVISGLARPWVPWPAALAASPFSSSLWPALSSPMCCWRS
jgi:hypothetical protein